MIRANVNNTSVSKADSLLNSYQKYLKTCMNDMEPVYIEYSMACDKYNLEYAIMESVSDDNQIMFEAAKKNFFQAVGEKLLELRDRFIKFVDGIIDKIKTASFNHKSQQQKVDKLLKDHPELKKETLLAVKEGSLDLKDIKSFKDLNDNYEEILRLARKGDIDPNSLRGKWEAAKEKFEKDADKIIAGGKVATGLVTAVLAVKTLPHMFKDADQKNKDLSNKRNEQRQKALETMKMIEKHSGDVYSKTEDIIEDRTSKEPIYETKKNKKGETIVKKDKNGNPIQKKDSNGNPMFKSVTKATNVGTKTTTTTTTSRTINANANKQCFELILNADRYLDGKVAQAMGQNLSIIQKIQTSLYKFVDKHLVSDRTRENVQRKLLGVDSSETIETIKKKNDDGSETETKRKIS